MVQKIFFVLCSTLWIKRALFLEQFAESQVLKFGAAVGAFTWAYFCFLRAHKQASEPLFMRKNKNHIGAFLSFPLFLANAFNIARLTTPFWCGKFILWRTYHFAIYEANHKEMQVRTLVSCLCFQHYPPIGFACRSFVIKVRVAQQSADMKPWTKKTAIPFSIFNVVVGLCRVVLKTFVRCPTALLMSGLQGRTWKASWKNTWSSKWRHHFELASVNGLPHLAPWVWTAFPRCPLPCSQWQVASKTNKFRQNTTRF